MQLPNHDPIPLKMQIQFKLAFFPFLTITEEQLIIHCHSLEFRLQQKCYFWHDIRLIIEHLDQTYILIVEKNQRMPREIDRLTIPNFAYIHLPKKLKINHRQMIDILQQAQNQQFPCQLNSFSSDFSVRLKRTLFRQTLINTKYRI